MAYTLQKPAPGASDPTAKNRVWDFFDEPTKPRPKNRRQPQQPRRKNRPCSYKTASGIPLWPSRDPIEEVGGMNLYGFVRNDGVNSWDFLGNIELDDETIYVSGGAPQWGQKVAGEHINKGVLWVGAAAKCAVIIVTSHSMMHNPPLEGLMFPSNPAEGVYKDGMKLDERHKGHQMTISGFSFDKPKVNPTNAGKHNIGVQISVSFSDDVDAEFEDLELWLWLGSYNDPGGKLTFTYSTTSKVKFENGVHLTADATPGILFENRGAF